MKLPEYSPYAEHFVLDREVVFLNHGSFGACPKPVLEAQSELRERLEREPIHFLARQLEGLLDEARAELGVLVGASHEQLAFVANATTAVNTVLRSLDLSPGDELIVTDHGYAACKNAIDQVALDEGAVVVTAKIPFPIDSPDRVVEAVLGAVTPRTKFVLIDHITSPTGLVLPVEKIVPKLVERGIEVMVDGAHAPGMLPLQLDELGATYYCGNCHKWLCTPKGCALLYVRRDKLPHVRPLVISHGATSKRTDRSRFLLEFDFTGTDDPTPYLVVPRAIRFLSSLIEGGMAALMASNRALALEARAILCRTLEIAPPAPEEMIGTLVTLPLPPSRGEKPKNPYFSEILQEVLFEKHHIEVPVFNWPNPPARKLRIAAQIYNSRAQYEALARALTELLPTL